MYYYGTSIKTMSSRRRMCFVALGYVASLPTKYYVYVNRLSC